MDVLQPSSLDGLGDAGCPDGPWAKSIGEGTRTVVWAVEGA